MSHLLDKSTYATTVWDKGALRFQRSDRRQGQLAQTIRERHPKSYKNPIIRTMWDAFPGMAMWCLWKECNARIFRDHCKDVETMWKTVKDNLLSSI